MSGELAKTADAPLVPANEPPNVMGLLQQAVAQGLGVDQLEKLVDLEERISKRRAAEEFAGAMAAFQKNCPPVLKNRTAEVNTNSGTGYSYAYANTQDIIQVVRPVLYEHGLSFTWDSEATDSHVTETCTLRHVNGHSVTASARMPTESRAGMSSQQKCEAASTYAQRASLSKVLGIVTSDGAPPQDDPGPVITPEQHNEIGGMIVQSGADTAKFLAFAGVKELAEIRQGDFPRLVESLRRKMSENAKEAKS